MRYRAIILYFWCLLFPMGVWLGLEGYEVASMLFLIIGWAPVALFITVKLITEPPDFS